MPVTRGSRVKATPIVPQQSPEESPGRRPSNAQPPAPMEVEKPAPDARGAKGIRGKKVWMFTNAQAITS